VTNTATTCTFFLWTLSMTSRAHVPHHWPDLCFAISYLLDRVHSLICDEGLDTKTEIQLQINAMLIRLEQRHSSVESIKPHAYYKESMVADTVTVNLNIPSTFGACSESKYRE
jgi:hypothetical protein